MIEATPRNPKAASRGKSSFLGERQSDDDCVNKQYGRCRQETNQRDVTGRKSNPSPRGSPETPFPKGGEQLQWRLRSSSRDWNQESIAAIARNSTARTNSVLASV